MFLQQQRYEVFRKFNDGKSKTRIKKELGLTTAEETRWKCVRILPDDLKFGSKSRSKGSGKTDMALLLGKMKGDI